MREATHGAAGALAIAGLVSATLVLLIPLGFGNVDLSIRGGFLAFPLIAGIGVYWYRSRGPPREETRESRPNSPRVGVRTCRLASGLLIALAVVISVITANTLATDGFIGLAAVALAAELFLGGQRISGALQGLFLLRSSALGVLAALQTTLTVPFFFGNFDTILHTTWIDRLVGSGRVDAASLSAYQYFPLGHVLDAMAVFTSNLTAYTSEMVMAAVSTQVSALFFYLVARLMIRDHRVALGAGLIVSLAPFTMLYAVFAVPQTLGIAFFASVLFLSLRKGEGLLRLRVLMVLLILAWILTHQVSVLIGVCVLGLSYVARRAWAPKSDIGPGPNSVLLIAIFMLGYWTLFTVFFSDFITRITQVFQGELLPSQTLTTVPGVPALIGFYTDRIFPGILLFLITLAVLRLARRDGHPRDRNERQAILVGALLAVVYFQSPLWLVPPLSAIEITRWLPFIEPLVLIGAFIGGSRFRWKSHSRNLNLVLACAIVFTLVFGSLASPTASFDRSLSASVGVQIPRAFFTSSEIAAMNFAGREAPSRISCDLACVLWLGQFGGVTTGSLYHVGPLVAPSSGVSLIRVDAFEGGGFGLATTQPGLYKRWSPVDFVSATHNELELAKWNDSVVYSSGSTVMVVVG